VPGRAGEWSGIPANRVVDVSGVSDGALIAIGAAVGLVLGIVVSVITDLPLAPELGVLLGAVVAWLSRRERGT
jgi:hypothetical protein